MNYQTKSVEVFPATVFRHGQLYVKVIATFEKIIVVVLCNRVGHVYLYVVIPSVGIINEALVAGSVKKSIISQKDRGRSKRNLCVL